LDNHHREIPDNDKACGTTGHTNRVLNLAMSPDGTTVLSIDEKTFRPDTDNCGLRNVQGRTSELKVLENYILMIVVVFLSSLHPDLHAISLSLSLTLSLWGERP